MHTVECVQGREGNRVRRRQARQQRRSCCRGLPRSAMPRFPACGRAPLRRRPGKRVPRAWATLRRPPSQLSRCWCSLVMRVKPRTSSTARWGGPALLPAIQVSSRVAPVGMPACMLSWARTLPCRHPARRPRPPGPPAPVSPCCQGMGDALLTYENEVFFTNMVVPEKDRLPYIVPDNNIRVGVGRACCARFRAATADGRLHRCLPLLDIGKLLASVARARWRGCACRRGCRFQPQSGACSWMRASAVGPGRRVGAGSAVLRAALLPVPADPAPGPDGAHPGRRRAPPLLPASRCSSQLALFDWLCLTLLLLFPLHPRRCCLALQVQRPSPTVADLAGDAPPLCSPATSPHPSSTTLLLPGLADTVPGGPD